MSIASLDIDEPMALYNVDPSQMWCLNTCDQPCTCETKRGHIQASSPAGTIVNKKTCKYLKATDPKMASIEVGGVDIPGTILGQLSLVEVKTYLLHF